MSDIATIVSALNLLGLGGLGLFIYYVVKGLRERIQALTDLASEQSKTLDVVRTRALELDQLRKDYKQAVDDFQDIGHKLEERRNAVIRELEAANKQKDDELARLKTLELEEIELKKRSLERVPEIEERLTSTVRELEKQVRIFSEGSNASQALVRRFRNLTYDMITYPHHSDLLVDNTLWNWASRPILESGWEPVITTLLLDKALTNKGTPVTPPVAATQSTQPEKEEDITAANIAPSDLAVQDIAPETKKK
jgi:hypothetical protein